MPYNRVRDTESSRPFLGRDGKSPLQPVNVTLIRERLVMTSYRSRDVPPSFARFNAVIGLSERGAEDGERDYLAQLVFEEEAP